jgi:hypothetical protein
MAINGVTVYLNVSAQLGLTSQEVIVLLVVLMTQHAVIVQLLILLTVQPAISVDIEMPQMEILSMVP